MRFRVESLWRRLTYPKDSYLRGFRPKDHTISLRGCRKPNALPTADVPNFGVSLQMLQAEGTTLRIC